MSSKIASSGLSDKAAQNHTSRRNSNVRKLAGRMNDEQRFGGLKVILEEVTLPPFPTPLTHTQTHTNTSHPLKPVWTEVPQPRKRRVLLWQMSSLGLASSFSPSAASLIMQRAFAQTCLTDVHRLSLRFPAARQQPPVIFRGRLYDSCTLCF